MYKLPSMTYIYFIITYIVLHISFMLYYSHFEDKLIEVHTEKYFFKVQDLYV